jgi:acetyl/propionyl-CoA carboxylase alpha subunit
MKETTHKTPNALIYESSPYLLQHAYNPVKWRAYNDEAFALAKAENKLIIISIGYSSCHWCHVMEHESFVSGKFDTHFVAKHFTPEALIEHPTDEENIVSALFSAHYNAESENHTVVVESVAHPAHYSGWKKRAYKR